jgi:hypothetical protein
MLVLFGHHLMMAPRVYWCMLTPIDVRQSGFQRRLTRGSRQDFWPVQIEKGMAGLG